MRRQSIARQVIGLVLGICLMASLSAATPVDVARLTERAARVEIIRDDYGVPHVYAKTDADVVFGLLYAQAEDDFPRIEQNYIWAIGRLAEVEGEAALYSDLRARLYMTVGEAQAAYASAPAWLQALCDAWADGLNFYLHTHPDVEPRLLDRFEPWMPMFFSEGSIGGDIEQIPVRGIAAFYGGLDPAEALAAEQTSAAAFSAPGGSNGFAISGEHTASGNAMLLINPHTSFYFRGEVHAVSEEGLNAYGAVTWGQFFVYQGFNEKTGWMHTSTYVDFIDQFVEDVSLRDGQPHYRYGDEWRPVASLDVTLAYKDGDALRERQFTMYRTHHGPITHAQDGRWVATKINWDPVNALIQSFTRTKLDNYAEFREMMNIRTNSSNNTVFADGEGNIAYFHGNFVPRRSLEFDYSKPVDGSDPATDWQGLHTVDETITILNPPNGWIQNANSTPFTAAAEHSPKRQDYPAYMAPDRENFRGVHAVRVLSGIEDLTLDGLIELAHDPYLPGFEQLIGGLLQAWDESETKDPALAAPLALLSDWDFATSADSVAMTLAHFYGNHYLAATTFPEGMSEMQKIEALGKTTERSERLAMFAETLAALEADFGDWQIRWGDVNRFQRLSGAIDLQYDDDQPSLPVGFANSRWGALADFGAKRFGDNKKLYGDNGNSFVAAVEFGERLRAKTILVGGQSNDPRSAHFVDQAEPYINQQFKPVAYYREDVEARAELVYRPGERPSVTVNDGEPSVSPWLIAERELPLPAAASDALRAAIAAQPQPDPDDAWPVPADAASWQQAIDAVNEMREPAARQLLESLPISWRADTLAGVNVHRLIPDAVSPTHRDHIVLELHGGAYVYGRGITGLHEAALLARRVGIPVIAVDYRMPPSDPFPAALEDALAVYQALLNQYDARQIMLAGTSAGGGLALALTHRLKALGLPMPAAIYVGTPWADLTKTGDTLYSNEGIDRVLVKYDGGLAAAARLYAGNTDLRDPMLSPVYGNFSGFPPTLLVTGTRDMFLSDAARTHRRMRDAGVTADLLVYEGLSHAGYLISPTTEESRSAYREIAAFADRHLR